MIPQLRVILDSNVLLSALMSSRGVPHLIWNAWQEGHFLLVTSRVQLEELRRVMGYPKIKKYITVSQASVLLNCLVQAEVMDYLPNVAVQLADMQDVFLLQMALGSGADYLVTGDARSGLLPMGRFSNTTILTPKDFYSRVLLSLSVAESPL